MLNAHPGILLRSRTFQVVSHNASWADHGKHAARMQAISIMMMILGQPFFWPVIHPSDMNSPLFMHCGGHNVDLASTCHKQMPDYISRVKTGSRLTLLHLRRSSMRLCRPFLIGSSGLGQLMMTAVPWGKCRRISALTEGQFRQLMTTAVPWGKCRRISALTEGQFRPTLHAHLLL